MCAWLEGYRNYSLCVYLSVALLRSSFVIFAGQPDHPLKKLSGKTVNYNLTSLTSHSPGTCLDP